MMRALKLMSSLSGSVALLALAITPLGALAAGGPGTSTDNLTTVTAGYVSDATGGGKAQSSAQFTVAPGALSLNRVPNILLSSTNVENIATASTTLTANGGNVTSAPTYDGNSNGLLDVSDYRGNHAGWTLTVGMGPFASGTNTINSATLNLNTTKGVVDNSATGAPANLALTQSPLTSGWVTSPQTLWNAAANSGEGANNATAATTTNLQVGEQPTISAGTYTATLYWTLQNSPIATPAK